MIDGTADMYERQDEMNVMQRQDCCRGRRRRNIVEPRAAFFVMAVRVRRVQDFVRPAVIGYPGLCFTCVMSQSYGYKRTLRYSWSRKLSRIKKYVFVSNKLRNGQVLCSTRVNDN